jgi:hypothetical protein
MKLDERIIENHRQLSGYSCIPMAVELILKLLGRASPDSLALQTEWNDRRSGSFSDFDGRIEKGVRFTRQFPQQRDDKFPLDRLFATIEDELAHGRYVAVALQVPGGWHNYVLYNQLPDGEFEAVTKGRCPERITDVKQQVRDMNGTDILTYELL